jgi:hypothetical protein
VIGHLKVTAAAWGIVGLTFSAQYAKAAEIKAVPVKDGRILIEVTGEILSGDSDKFSQTVKQANDAGKFVANLRLNSEGGSLLEGVKLAEAVRFGKMSTNVGKRAVCASACFLVFAAGSTKFASYGAQIGVHGASEQGGSETVSSEAATVSMAKVAKELGVPPTIIGKMVVTPPSEMVWLTPEDLQSMGVTMVGKPIQVQPSASASLQQTPPDGPVSILPPQSNAAQPQAMAPPSNDRTANVPTWSEMVEIVTQRSASQNHGKPMLDRHCQPELKVCITAISYVDNEGNVAFLKRVEDIDGKTIAREACTLNKFGDVRTCLNWDNRTFHKDMKDEHGNWVAVTNQ